MAVNLTEKLTDAVKLILLEFSQARESDEVLIVKTWVRINPELKKFSFAEFCLMFKAQKLPSVESIMRCRRKLQEEFPELRGTNYLKRQAKQSKIKEQLKGNQFKKK